LFGDMAIDYKDPKLLAQMSLTNMVQSSRAGLTTGKAGFIIQCQQSAKAVIDLLNNVLGSVSPNSFFSLDNDGSVRYEGEISLHIPELLLQVKNHESEVYNKSSGKPATIEDVIRNIRLADLSGSGNDNSSKNDKIAI
jgi:hypothetical protein